MQTQTSCMHAALQYIHAQLSRCTAHTEHSKCTHQKGGLPIVQLNVCPSEAALKTSGVTASLQATMLLWQIKLT